MEDVGALKDTDQEIVLPILLNFKDLPDNEYYKRKYAMFRINFTYQVAVMGNGNTVELGLKSADFSRIPACGFLIAVRNL